MISWSDLQSQAQYLVGDTTASVLTALKRDMNTAIRDIRAKMGASYVMEEEYTVTAAVSTQYQPLPADFFKVKFVSWEQSDIKYTLEQVHNPVVWDRLNQETANTGSPPTHFYIRHRAGRDELGLFPIPSVASDSNGLVIGYIMDPPDLSVDDSTITIGVTADDETITSSAAFTQAMVDGKRWIRGTEASGGDHNWYRMITFTSTSSVELERKYEGATDASVTATVAQIPLIPKNTDHLPTYFAAAHFFFRKRDFPKGREMMGLYLGGIRDAIAYWNQKSTQQVAKHGRRPFFRVDPNIPPRNLTSV